MKVLFVCSGNVKGFEIVPFIKDQGESLKRLGVDLDYFPIVGKGLPGYIRAGFRLRKYLKDHPVDLIHAHFILSGCAAVLGSRSIPVVLSLMGSDAYGEYVGERKVLFFSRYLTLLTWLIQPFVDAIISKSGNIERYVYLRQKSFIIPNGIDTDKFKPDLTNRREALGFDLAKKQILFLGSKSNVRKNLALAQHAIALMQRNDIQFINPYPVDHQVIPHYLNATNVLAVCSYMEGSPNVVKEAMACNCPIVATDVGDVAWVLGDTEGCYVSSFDVKEFAKNIERALEFSKTKGRTNGMQRIQELKLDSKSVAERVLTVYEKVLRKAL